MSDSFSRAAIERIAQCASGRTVDGGLTEQYIREHWWSNDAQSVRFAELTELAVVAGYVDLGEMDERPLFAQELETLCSKVREKLQDRADLSLALDLLQRLRGNAPLRIGKRDDNAFHAFAAYLGLAERTLKDDDFHRFVARTGAEESSQTMQSWQPRDDLAFLVSPRHFAEALIRGRIGGLATPDAAGGVRAMGYLMELQDFMERTDHAGELRDGALRQAKWSHRIDLIEQRLDLWHGVMAEWIDAEGESESVDLLVDLSPLKTRLRELGLTPVLAPPKRSVWRVDQLLALGRSGAAIQALQLSLKSHGDMLDEPSTQKEVALMRYIKDALLLSDIGQSDEAAAWLARIGGELADPPHSLNADDLRRARAVLAEARQSSPTSGQVEKVKEAQRRIIELAPEAEVEVGKVYDGTVRTVLDFGAIVQILPGRDGLLHISQIPDEPLGAATYLKVGQAVKVKVIEADAKGRVRLSMKAVASEAAKSERTGGAPAG